MTDIASIKLKGKKHDTSPEANLQVYLKDKLLADLHVFSGETHGSNKALFLLWCPSSIRDKAVTAFIFLYRLVKLSAFCILENTALLVSTLMLKIVT